MRRSMLLLWSAIVAGLVAQSSAELVLVYSIQRHGARNVLPKSYNLSESDSLGGPTLLPVGQELCNGAGTSFHQRYIDLDHCGDTCLTRPDEFFGDQYGVHGTEGVGFDNYNTHVHSSALDRTLLSAYSFFQGVFPPLQQDDQTTRMQQVPVYSMQESEDWVIRAYTRCPTYQNTLKDWFASDEFRAQEDSTMEFRERIGQLIPGMNVSLANWWNVYDAVNVHRMYGVGNPVPDVDDDTFKQMVELANWLEVSKMRYNLTSNLLGGPLVANIHDSMLAAINARDSSGAFLKLYYKLVSASAHYNTQLSVLSALNIESSPVARDIQWLKAIPKLAAVLAFELHADDMFEPNYYVRVVAQDGPQADYVNVPLPCAQDGDAAALLLGSGSCSWSSFSELAEAAAIPDVTEWCELCDNHQVLACQKYWMDKELQACRMETQLG